MGIGSVRARSPGRECVEAEGSKIPATNIIVVVTNGGSAELYEAPLLITTQLEARSSYLAKVLSIG
jgi:hypothetical protein